MKLSDSKHKLTCFVIMTLFPFYKNMLQFSGWSCSYKNGALAKFQPRVLNPFCFYMQVFTVHAAFIQVSEQPNKFLQAVNKININVNIQIKNICT